MWCLWLAGSHDRSIRRWERTSEPFFVEEEKERRLDSLFEADLEQQQQRQLQQMSGMVLGRDGATFVGAAAGAQPCCIWFCGVYPMLCQEHAVLGFYVFLYPN
jgi:hypothetical protein